MQISAANLLVASQPQRAAAVPKQAAFTPQSFDAAKETDMASEPAKPAPSRSATGYAPAARPGSQLDIRV